MALQTGDKAGDLVVVAFINEGTLQGRGDATEGNTIPDSLLLFSDVADARLLGLIENTGVIAGSADSDIAAGIRIDGGLTVQGPILNQGEITGTVNAIDARDGGPPAFINDVDAGDGVLIDIGQISGVIDGGAGDDERVAGAVDKVLVGGLGNDTIGGGVGNDTADFSDLDVAETVNRGPNGNGTATRDTGFKLLVTEQVATDGAAFVAAAEAGNLCSNVHTSAFPGGEIRDQLSVVSDSGTGHNRVIELAGPLDASQESGPTSDSTATGEGLDTLTINEHGAVVCCPSLSVVGLKEADLQSPVRGPVSAIHLHKAPAGQNSPIVQDMLVDAGSMLDPLRPASMSSARVVTRWPNSDRRTSPLD
ncbi:MAG: CHRD domain-containing protein, partial [Pseudomonadota bacterium]